MNKRWGELANKWGTVVEDIVAPSVRRLAREVFDCGELQYFATRVSRIRSDDPGREREFDALYVGTRAVLLNETRSSPRSNDARRFARFVESGEFAGAQPGFDTHHIPQTVIGASGPGDGSRRKIFSSQLLCGARSKTIRWPEAAPHRSR